MLKVEPNVLKQVLCITGRGHAVADKDYGKLSALVSQGRRKEAVEKATVLVARAFGLKADILRETKRAVTRLRQRRLGRSPVVTEDGGG